MDQYPKHIFHINKIKKYGGEIQYQIVNPEKSTSNRFVPFSFQNFI